jgi:FlaA1/EpsC-like NDP-sugar epimerase
MEAIKTNIHGAENVVRAALLHGVPQVVALSSDKAAAPTNLYGATKLASDKLFIHANSLTGGRDQRFSVVRYGNVLGSRGSVVPLFLKERHSGRLTLTHPEMTRFSITLDQEVETVLHALQYAWGGELFVPKIPSFRLTDLAEAIGPQCERIYTGVRPGEKLHEDMITPPDALLTVELADYYVVLPSVPTLDRTAFKAAFDGRDVPTNFCYHSANNTAWLSVEALRAAIRTHVDPRFAVG